MHTLMVEFALGASEAIEEIRRVGAEPIPGYEPVSVRGEGGEEHVVVSIRVADDAVQRALESLPGVVGVFGDPRIAPFGDAVSD